MENCDLMNNDTNYTTINNRQWPLFFYDPEIQNRGIYSFQVGIIIFMSNLLVVISSGLLFKKGLKPKCPYLLLGSIALTDLITGLMAMMIWIYPNNRDSIYPCSIYIGVVVTTTVVSFYSVALLALDRFLYIVHGLKYNIMVYPRRVRKMILGTWIFGVSVGIVPVTYLARVSPVCWLSLVTPKLFPTVITVLGGIPVFSIIVLYAMILKTVWANSRRVRKLAKNRESTKTTGGDSLRFSIGGSISSISMSINSSEVSSSNETYQQKEFDIDGKASANKRRVNAKGRRLPCGSPLGVNKWKAVKIVTLTAGNTLMIWIMYCTTTVMLYFCEKKSDPFSCEKQQVSVGRLVGLLGFAHHIFNPIIYYWWHNGFRHIVDNILCKS